MHTLRELLCIVSVCVHCHRYSPTKFPLSKELEAKGMTDEQWATVCAALAKGKGMVGFGWGFSQAINAVSSPASFTCTVQVVR